MNGYTPSASSSSSPDSFSNQGRRLNREKYHQRQNRTGSPIRDPSANYASPSPTLNRAAAGEDECLASPAPARRRHTYPGDYSIDNTYSPSSPCAYPEKFSMTPQPADYTQIHHSARGSWAPVRRIDFDEPEETASPLQNHDCMGNQCAYMDPSTNYATPQNEYADMRRSSSPALNEPSPGNCPTPNNLAPPQECFNNPRYPGETPIHYFREGVNPFRRIDFDAPEESDLPKPDPSCFRDNQLAGAAYTSLSSPDDSRFGFPARRPAYRPPEEPQCFSSPRNYPASDTFSPSALEGGCQGAPYADYTPIHYSMKGSRRPRRRINGNEPEEVDQNYYSGAGSPDNLIDFSCPTPQSTLNQQMKTPLQPMRQDLIDFNTSCPAPQPSSRQQVDRRFPTISAPGLPSPMQPCRKDPRQRPKSNLNELEANETLDEMIDTTIRGFDRIAKSLKKRPNLRNLANLPTDRDKLNEVLQHSIRQTESSLSLLRQGMQETLLEMSRILGKRTALQVPEIRNLVNDFEKRKCQRQGQLVECPKEERLSSAPSTSQEKPAEGAEAIAPKEEEEAKEKEKEEEEGKEKEGEEEKEKEGE